MSVELLARLLIGFILSLGSSVSTGSRQQSSCHLASDNYQGMSFAVGLAARDPHQDLPLAACFGGPQERSSTSTGSPTDRWSPEFNFDLPRPDGEAGPLTRMYSGERKRHATDPSMPNFRYAKFGLKPPGIYISTLVGSAQHEDQPEKRILPSKRGLSSSEARPPCSQARFSSPATAFASGASIQPERQVPAVTGHLPQSENQQIQSDGCTGIVEAQQKSPEYHFTSYDLPTSPKVYFTLGESGSRNSGLSKLLELPPSRPTWNEASTILNSHDTLTQVPEGSNLADSPFNDQRRLYFGSDAMPWIYNPTNSARTPLNKSPEEETKERTTNIIESDIACYKIDGRAFEDDSLVRGIFKTYASVNCLYNKDGSIDREAFKEYCTHLNFFSSRKVKRKFHMAVSPEDMVFNSDRSYTFDVPVPKQVMLLEEYFSATRVKSGPRKINLYINVWINLCRLFVLRKQDYEHNLKIMMQEPFYTYFYLGFCAPSWAKRCLAGVNNRTRADSLSSAGTGTDDSNSPEALLAGMQMSSEGTRLIAALLTLNALLRSDAIELATIRSLRILNNNLDMSLNYPVYFETISRAFTSKVFAESIASAISSLIVLEETNKNVHAEPIKKFNRILDKIARKIEQLVATLRAAQLGRPRESLDPVSDDESQELQLETRAYINKVNSTTRELATGWCTAMNNSGPLNRRKIKYGICTTLRIIAEMNRTVLVLAAVPLNDKPSVKLYGNDLGGVFRCVLLTRFDPARVKLFFDSLSYNNKGLRISLGKRQSLWLKVS